MSSVCLPGRYLDEAGVERDCMLCGDTPDVLEIIGDRAPVPGERIVCRIPGLGLFRGRTAERTNGAFRLDLEAGPDQRGRLAARLAWHAAQMSGASERREAVRVVPIRTGVVVVWDGAEVHGCLRDVSANGASVDLAPRPGIGTPIVIGRRRGHVVRHTEAGIGVRFVLPLSSQDVTENIVL
ncbi:PilZ domain-containing protein [Methylorubrum populi]